MSRGDFTAELLKGGLRGRQASAEPEALQADA